jgi:hypothetical protein
VEQKEVMVTIRITYLTEVESTTRANQTGGHWLGQLSHRKTLLLIRLEAFQVDSRINHEARQRSDWKSCNKTIYKYFTNSEMFFDAGSFAIDDVLRKPAVSLIFCILDKK